ncbi:MAG: SIS domain-containing protein [Gammaproteobacteria bacterium]|nr:SIS domain-containing protein [Gammaproteobacteria bacterium]
MTSQVKNAITESIQIKIEAADTLPEYIERAGELMVQCLIDGGKILTCGNGSCAATASQFSSILLDRLARERPSLPAINLVADPIILSSMANNGRFEDVFARQVRALGTAKDILLVYSSKGQSKSIIKAIESALSRDMLIIAMTGADGGSVAGLVSGHDVEIRVPANSTARICEVHMLITHVLCDYIDNSLFGEQV